MTTPEDILAFWFPPDQPLDRDEAALRAQVRRWFRGGTNDEIRTRFTPTLEAASHDELDAWAATPRGRLALILVLDQFSRAVFTDSRRAFAQDPKAQQLAGDGIARGDDRMLALHERLFFVLPFGHAEELALSERAVAYVTAMIDEAPPQLRAIYEMSAGQARAHRDVIARFGRHPHRNAVLGRTSTPDEEAYIARGEFPHTRPNT